LSVQRCPRCGSKNIRKGYQHTAWWSALIGRYNLLCNNCNWEFVGFAFPGSLSKHSRKRRSSNSTKPLSANTAALLVESSNLSENGSLSEIKSDSGFGGDSQEPEKFSAATQNGSVESENRSQKIASKIKKKKLRGKIKSRRHVRVRKKK
jgi:hypothetical protein